MESDLLRKVQLVQLDIAIEFRRICEKYGLAYFLESGTLLGAVRHKGFIPWDDDLDMSMPREDYERFLTVASAEMNENYYLVSWNKDIEYPHPFSKIMKKGTVYKESKDGSHGSKCGVYIDIFPYDVFPQCINEQKRQKRVIMYTRALVRAKCHCKTWITADGIDVKKYLKNIPIRILSIFYNKYNLVSKYDKTAKRYNSEDSGKVFTNGAFAYGQEVHSNRCVRDFCELEFEGEIFKAPSNYDEFLKELYGDYWILPPVEERGNQHIIREIVL